MGRVAEANGRRSPERGAGEGRFSRVAPRAEPGRHLLPPRRRPPPQPLLRTPRIERRCPGALPCRRGLPRSVPEPPGRETRLPCRSARATRQPRPSVPGPRCRPAPPTDAPRCPLRIAMLPCAATVPARARDPARCLPRGLPRGLAPDPCSMPSRTHCFGHSAARSTNVIFTSSNVNFAGSFSPSGRTRLQNFPHPIGEHLPWIVVLRTAQTIPQHPCRRDEIRLRTALLQPQPPPSPSSTPPVPSAASRSRARRPMRGRRSRTAKSSTMRGKAKMVL